MLKIMDYRLLKCVLAAMLVPVVLGQADNGPIRLWRSGTTSLSYSSGRVQLMYNSRWGNICDEFGSFNLTEATVICHQLGFTDASAYNRASDDQFGNDTSPAVLSGVNCSTSVYLVILQCSFDSTASSSCTDNDDVSIVCISTRIWSSPYSSQIRLTGGDSVNQGLVEVFCREQWGTVCDDHFDQADADTVCRQLGYDRAYKYDKSIQGNSTQPIWLDDLPCSSPQPCIANCTICPSYQNCDHTEDIAIECYSPFHYTGTTTDTCSGNTTDRRHIVNDTCSTILDDGLYQHMTQAGSCMPYLPSFRNKSSICDNVFTAEDNVYIPYQRVRGDQRRLRMFIEDASIFLMTTDTGISNKQCLDVMNKALCVHYYLPCGSNSSIHVPQFLCPDTCRYVTDECRDEWQTTMDLLEHVYTITPSLRNAGFDLPICNNTSKIIASLNLSDDCCNNGGVVIPASVPPNTSTMSFATYHTQAPNATSGKSVLISASVGSTVGVVVLLVSIIVVNIVICTLCAKKGKNDRTPAEDLSLIQGNKIYVNTWTNANQHESFHSQVVSVNMRQLGNFIISKTQLHLIEILGQGEFGIVYRGLLLPESKNDMPKAVAVKTLKGQFSSDDISSIMEESLKMKYFDHVNVLSLLGVCVDTGSAPYIVMPLMSHGSLLSYLKKERHNLTVAEGSDIELVLSVQKQLLSMCLQVAQGMAYLASQKFVHRDLAARNCMVASSGVIKVADFGLTEDVYHQDYFRQDSSKVKLPVKWMSLESLHDRVFSEKSDVWSFGVTSWEVFSLGRMPYPGTSPAEVVELLDSGSRLTQPTNAACSDEIFRVMLSCWIENPAKRPTFYQLVHNITTIMKPLVDYMDFSDVYYKQVENHEENQATDVQKAYA